MVRGRRLDGNVPINQQDLIQWPSRRHHWTNTPAILNRDLLKAVIKAVLVDRERNKDVAIRLGVPAQVVSNVRTGKSYMAARAEIIKELRSEGHTVHLQ